MEDVDYLKEKDWKEFCEKVLRICEDKNGEYIIDEKVHNRYDKGYKYLLSIKRNFIDFLKTFIKIGLEEDITEENIKLMDKEFITIDFEKRESDLIYEIKTKKDKVYFVLLEMQSKVDKMMAYRLLNYMVEIWRKDEGNIKSCEEYKLPKIIPCVLYNGRNKWTAPIEFKNLYDDVERNEEYLINFKYILVDVHRYKPEHLLEMSNVISSAFYLDSSTKQTMEQRLKTLIKKLSKLTPEEIKEIKRWIVNTMAFTEDQHGMLEKEILKGGEEAMTNLERISREIYEDGIKEGIAREKNESKTNLERISREIYEDGIEKGKTLSLWRILSKKLNEDNCEMKKLIEKSSKEKLDEIEDRIFEITSWEDVVDIINGR